MEKYLNINIFKTCFRIIWNNNHCKLIFAMVICFLASSFIINTQTKKFQLTGTAQGTTWQIIYYAADSLISEKQVYEIFNDIDQSMSLYKPNSIINKFNASEKGIIIDHHLEKVIKKSIDVYHQTNGVFEVTVKPLVEAWGFGVKQSNANPDKKSKTVA